MAHSDFIQQVVLRLENEEFARYRLEKARIWLEDLIKEYNKKNLPVPLDKLRTIKSILEEG